MRLTAWPVPQAVRRSDGARWRDFVPEFRVIHPYRPTPKRLPRVQEEDPRQLSFGFLEETHSEHRQTRLTPAQQRKEAFDRFRFSMPKPVGNVLEPFRNNQWPLLVLLRYDEGALELAESNPALAFSLAQHLRADRELIESLQCCRMRQRDLLEVLELPSSNRAVNLFRKISPLSINGDNWSAMVAVIRSQLAEEKSPLLHLPTINSGVVEILGDARISRAATAGLLREVSRDRAECHRGRVVHLIASTLRMQDELRNQDRVSSFASKERLLQVHAEVTERYRRRIRQLTEANRHDTDFFRNPPFPGIPGKIEPITSVESLVDEGEEQGNCVASYASRVRAGSTFIYRVLEPERATLSIVRSSPLAAWTIGELEARYNSDVQPETDAFVDSWLERNRSLVD